MSARVEALERILAEISDGYAEFYESGSLDRLLNGESLIRGLWPPLIVTMAAEHEQGHR